MASEEVHGLSEIEKGGLDISFMREALHLSLRISLLLHPHAMYTYIKIFLLHTYYIYLFNSSTILNTTNFR